MIPRILSRISTGRDGAIAADKDTLSWIASRAMELKSWRRGLEVVMGNGTGEAKEKSRTRTHVVGEENPQRELSGMIAPATPSSAVR